MASPILYISFVLLLVFSLCYVFYGFFGVSVFLFWGYFIIPILMTEEVL